MKTKTTAIYIVLTALTLTGGQSAALPAQDRAAPKTPPKKADVGAKVVDLAEALNRKLPDIHFPGVSLQDVLQFLREATGTNIVVRWNWLKEEGFEPNMPVSLDVKGVTLKTVLETVLRDLKSSFGAETHLDYAVKGEVLVISVDKDGDLQEMTTVVYDVGEIVDGAEESEIAGLVNSLMPMGVLAKPQLVRGSLIVTTYTKEHQQIREMIEQVKKNLAARPPSAKAMGQQSQEQIRTIVSMKQTCFDPQAMCVAALGCLRTETNQPPAELAKTLETLLAETKAVGVRNAIRLTLKDLYGQMGNMGKVKEHLEGIIKDNEKACQDAGGNR
jgi:hypothetical protein